MENRLLLALGFLVLATGAIAQSGQDLGVRFISRYPLYYRYNVQYPNDLPQLASTHDNLPPEQDQHWPAPNEEVTYKATIRNHGTEPVSGFDFQWYIDGVAYGPLRRHEGTVAPGQNVTVITKWPWPANLNDHKVKIVVDPLGAFPDALRQNNTLEDYTNALSFSIWIEEPLYQRFNQRLNGFGTYSFDDWIQWHFRDIHRRFAKSRYPVFAPNGILERIRIEQINVVKWDPNDLHRWRTLMNQDPNLYKNDGRWQFVSERNTLPEKEAEWDTYVNEFVNRIDGGLIHELMHQLGVIDEYNMNMEPENNLVPTFVGRPLNAGHLFVNAGMMQDLNADFLEAHTAGYLNKNLHLRRGFFGEYLWDTPNETWIQVLDITGQPMAGVTAAFYQKDMATGKIPDRYAFWVMTDQHGWAKLPNRSVTPVTTATGYTRKPNPFGNIHVVGGNGVFCVRLMKNRQEDFRWVEINQLNEAYWRGERNSTTLTFRTHLIPGNVTGWSLNLARGKPVQASSGQVTAHLANDGQVGDTNFGWEPSPPAAGSWWQVDLGEVREIGKIQIYQNHDWFAKFHFEVSKTGNWAEDKVVIPAETDWDLRRTFSDSSVQALSGLRNRNVYTFLPVEARYVRVVSDVHQNWSKLVEFHVFSPTRGDGNSP